MVDDEIELRPVRRRLRNVHRMTELRQWAGICRQSLVYAHVEKARMLLQLRTVAVD